MTTPERSTSLIAGLTLTLIVIAILARLGPHLPNFTPIGAVALFSGVYLIGRWSWLVPLVVMLATDMVIGWYDLPIMASVYLSLGTIGLIGYAIRQHRQPLIIGLASLVGSVLFFVVTNAAVWAWGHLYPLTLTGLAASYVNALPFFRNTLLGDLGYTAVLFGGYALVTRLVTRRATQTLITST